jgi:nitric oxide reductase subunit B
MWSTGILFFLITFIEQNLWQIQWFRQSYLREITVQWKANGSMVGAWNQMIYGTFFFLMTRLSGDETLARGKKVYFFYFLGLTNLMFNWGHHIYNVPTAGWIRHVAYAISMTEWLFLINIIQGFKSKLSERRKLNHFITYRFLITAEIWVFINLLLAIAMSIPAINRYTHGTHITVAHAMGTTIGINTMILLGGIGYMIGIERLTARAKRILTITHYVAQVSLGIFWVSLVIAGILKGYRSVAMNITDFQLMMKPVFQVLTVFAIAGIGLLVGLGAIVIIYLQAIWNGIRITTDENNKR